MTIYLTQIYVEAGANFPLSHHFQLLAGKLLTDAFCLPPPFVAKYGSDFALVLRMSAKSSLQVVEIVGPTVFKRDKTVEFTIFIPFRKVPFDKTVFREVITLLMEGINQVFIRIGVGNEEITERLTLCAERILSADNMRQEIR